MDAFSFTGHLSEFYCPNRPPLLCEKETLDMKRNYMFARTAQYDDLFKDQILTTSGSPRFVL
ncbi:hypothetical protein KIN20_012068 [Parelaphostrongylus tenuis]|uniref:Uncharacterized protein n=1 Tax=Parelaphostrongylus tenuis TaxID=148309 RepID=A0AAD5MWG3_PARTN|nr:hypothetical protein KIN20_012068 [Parelaphostrongylus tenuis]